MQKDKINSIVEAYKSMYDEDVLSENILSNLTAHGRYMNKLKAAHDHHMNMSNGHGSLEDKMDPSRGRKGAGEDGNPDYDEDRKYNHARANDTHRDAADSIKKLAAHAKKHKLTTADHPGLAAFSHPSGYSGDYTEAKKLFKQAARDSAAAHTASHTAIKYDNAEGDSHMDHTKKLAKHVTYKSGSAHKHL